MLSMAEARAYQMLVAPRIRWHEMLPNKLSDLQNILPANDYERTAHRYVIQRQSFAKGTT